MYYSLHAIVLSRRILGENDRLILVFSQEMGKKNLLALGAQKITAKMAGSVDPLMRVFLSVVKGKQFDRIIGVEIEEAYDSMRVDTYRVALARYLMQLVDRLSAEDHSDSGVYQLLEDALQFIDCQVDREGSLRLISGFILKLLSYTGWRPDLDQLGLSHEGRDLFNFLFHKPFTEFSSIVCSIDTANHVVGVVQNSLAKQLEHLHLPNELPAQRFFFEMARMM